MQRGSRIRTLAGSALRAQPDRRLVRLAREGQAAAMEEIVRRYRPALVGFAARTVPAHRAEDVVQEALSRAMIALVESDREIQLKPWLYTIVRNRALNDLRDERPHEPIPDDFDGVPQPPDVVARRQEVSSLVAAIGALPSGQRDALVQRELEGRSHAEIAERLGSTPGAVRGLIFRARLTLRDAAGLVLPLPVLRWMLSEGGAPAAAAAGAGGAAAAGAAGGGGIAAKTGAAVVVATLALGSGVALREEGRDAGAEASSAGGGRADTNDSTPHPATTPGVGESGGPGPSANRGPSDRSGPGGGGERDDDSSGPGSGDDDDSSGPGGGGGDGDDNSGPGGGGEDHSGPGGGGELEREEENSGPGGGGDSGSSGSGTSGSGTSGSGTSGSGGSGSGSSGSGSGDGEPVDDPDDD